MKTATCLLAISAFVALPVWAQSTSSQSPQFAPVPPPPGMNDPGVKAVAPPAQPAPSSTSGSTPAEVTATPVPGKPIPLPAMPGDKGAPKMARGDSPADDVSVRTEGDAVYQEYRRGGRVYMVVVTQKSGLSYTYMVDSDGTMRATDGAPPVRPVMYKILEWGKSKPAESGDESQDSGSQDGAH
ncbi:DUF2782 domain-containing protein [Rhodanobacter sp. DHB23]|uniref:DUF2782 domain-containing protein n=1 Tax=Rhodanobacter sp. DHB23 TaxID=2775923 RepID=UPI001CE1D610|nr:DUF2782 domain-containing protein [Rhodanobacter sp. DHB23]